MYLSKKSEVRQRALKTAEKVARSFLEEYRSGPYANELSTDRVKFFYYTTDFEAGLNNALFWEFKRLELWQEITDDDWDDVVKLSMEQAYEYLVVLESQDTVKMMNPKS